jgi:hypothetical protein
MCIEFGRRTEEAIYISTIYSNSTPKDPPSKGMTPCIGSDKGFP